MNRTKSYDEMLSQKLRKSRKFRQAYLLSYIEDHDMTAEEALKETIRCMGLKEFAEISEVKHQNVCDFIKGRRNPKRETLDTYFMPFGLKTKIVVEKYRAA